MSVKVVEYSSRDVTVADPWSKVRSGFAVGAAGVGVTGSSNFPDCDFGPEDVIVGEMIGGAG